MAGMTKPWPALPCYLPVQRHCDSPYLPVCSGVGTGETQRDRLQFGLAPLLRNTCGQASNGFERMVLAICLQCRIEKAQWAPEIGPVGEGFPGGYDADDNERILVEPNRAADRPGV
jgi:hypothetical protein